MRGRTSAASSPSTERRYLLDPRARRLPGGLLLGGEPPRLVRLSPGGEAALEAALDPAGGGEPVEGSGALLEHLAGAGLAHPRPGHRCRCFSVTVVVPVRTPPASFPALLSSLGAAGAPVVVVDDGSPDGGRAARRAAGTAGATVVCRARSGGPAAARNEAAPSSELVFFLDADTVLAPAEAVGLLESLAAHFHDERVGLVAPRVRAVSTSVGPLSAYEERESPLDLGRMPGLVGTGRRLSYVPAAALACRRRALSEVGGFDESLRYGEDVDLVRRLEAAGWSVRYEPAVAVGHLVRAGLGALARQRVGYGSAAAALDRRHPRSVAPYAGSPFPTAAGACAALAVALSPHGRLALVPAAGAVVATAAPAVPLWRRLKAAGTPSAPATALGLTARSSLAATRALAQACCRAWWPLLVPLAVGRPARRPVGRLLGAAFLVRHLPRAVASAGEGRWAPDRARRLGSHLALGLVDDAAYCAGVLLGCVRERSPGALLPDLRRRPRDRRARGGPPA
ncbi:MAG TPA: mycofactocin biosynthesis glycosyltransferase MftF [Acidimicrobiales bacterium]|nr:mycofactocin biosynthesis glycosyltransferase MftF [Acidimicrobiales bacterium]